MPRLLLDANLSPETANFLRQEGHDVISVQEEGWGGLVDAEVVKLAKKEGRVIITFDGDFAQSWYLEEAGEVGVIWLKIKYQKVENVNKVLGSFLAGGFWVKEKLDKCLVVLRESSYKVVRW